MRYGIQRVHLVVVGFMILYAGLGIFIIRYKANDSVSSIPAGHWGERSDWRSDDWVQDYFADSDGHLVGWVTSTKESISFEARCAVNENISRYDIGNFDTDEDAQIAVEKQCLVSKQ